MQMKGGNYSLSLEQWPEAKGEREVQGRDGKGKLLTSQAGGKASALQGSGYR